MFKHRVLTHQRQQKLYVAVTGLTPLAKSTSSSRYTPCSTYQIIHICE